MDTFLNWCKIFLREEIFQRRNHLKKYWSFFFQILGWKTSRIFIASCYIMLFTGLAVPFCQTLVYIPSQTRGHKTINITYVPARFILYCNAFANLYNSILCIRDHPYITSAKELGGWGQKNDSFCWRSLLFILMWVKKSPKTCWSNI